MGRIWDEVLLLFSHASHFPGDFPSHPGKCSTHFGTDEKSGRRNRTRTSSEQLLFFIKNNRISDYTTILCSNVQRATTTIQYNRASCFYLVQFMPTMTIIRGAVEEYHREVSSSPREVAQHSWIFKL